MAVAPAAQRIISLAPSNTEIVFALGCGERLVGRSDACDYPPDARAVPSVGSLYPRLGVERLVVLTPDLVLAAGVTSADDVALLERLGLRTFATSIARRLDDIYCDIRAIGALVGCPGAADELIERMRARVTAVVEGRPDGSRPRVLYEIDATDPTRPWSAGRGSFIDQLISLAGGENVISSESDYLQVSLETLIVRDPEVILLGSSKHGGVRREDVLARRGWGSISAVRTGAVHPFDDDLVSRPGPRVVDGLETIASLLRGGSRDEGSR